MGDAVDFDEYIFRQAGDFHGGAGWGIFFKKAAVNFVHPRKNHSCL